MAKDRILNSNISLCQVFEPYGQRIKEEQQKQIRRVSSACQQFIMSSKTCYCEILSVLSAVDVHIVIVIVYLSLLR